MDNLDGWVFFSTFENAKAKECLEKALSITKELCDKKSQPAFYTNLRRLGNM